MKGIVIVTGCAGFLGSHLTRRLLCEGHEVLGIDNLQTGRKKNLADLSIKKNFTFAKLDISIDSLEFKKYRSQWKQVSEIYNLACPASPPQYQRNPIHTTLTSVLGSYNLLEWAKDTKARYFFASTSEVYGDPLVHPQSENYRGNVNTIGPRACYDEAKRVGETLAADYRRVWGVDTKIVRIFNTYGPSMDPQDGRLVSNLIVQALRNENLTIYGEGRQTRSLCFVDDLIEGFVLMMKQPFEFMGPVNLGNPKEFTVADLAQAVLNKFAGGSSKIIYKPLPEDDPRQRKPDITLAQTVLGWEPIVDLSLGLDRTIEYFRNEARWPES